MGGAELWNLLGDVTVNSFSHGFATAKPHMFYDVSFANGSMVDLDAVHYLDRLTQPVAVSVIILESSFLR